MAASIICWTAPKLATDLWRHITDFRNVWTNLKEETLIVQDNTFASRRS